MRLAAHCAWAASKADSPTLRAEAGAWAKQGNPQIFFMNIVIFLV